MMIRGQFYAGGPGGAPAAPAAFTSVTVTITPTQFKLLDGTGTHAITIVPAPGAGLAVEVDSWSCNKQFPSSGGVAYVAPAGTTPQLELGVIFSFSFLDIWGQIFLTSAVISAASVYGTSGNPFNQGTTGASIVLIANNALVLDIDPSAGGSYTVGNSPFVITVRYRIIPVS
jgi:hypothetical protein